jgi:hypothetical protein
VTVDVRVTRPDEYRAAADVFCIALMLTPPSDDEWERFGRAGTRCRRGRRGTAIAASGTPASSSSTRPCRAGSDSRPAPSHASACSRAIGAKASRRDSWTRSCADADERGLALMSLRASEATIYERFGFGWRATTSKPSSTRPAPARSAAPHPARSGSSTPTTILVTVMPIYERFAHRRPGCITRPASFWRRLFRAAIARSSPTFVAVHTDPTAIDDGYVLYETKWVDDGVDGGGVGRCTSCSPPTTRPSWRSGRTSATSISSAAGSSTNARSTTSSAVRRATSGPTARDGRRRAVAPDRRRRARAGGPDYGPSTGSVNVQVTDPLVPGNDGTWRISPAGAMRTHEPLTS